MDNKQYKKAVQHPKITDIVLPTSELKIQSLYQTEGETIYNGSCKFVATSQEISSYDDVRCGYIKVRRRHPHALHVSCAYTLPGSDVANSSDFEDNLEPGAGRILWQLLTGNGIVHRAIYVARYYGGKKLGPTRFHSYREAAISAIARSSYNSIIKKNQFPLRKEIGQERSNPNTSRALQGRIAENQQGYTRVASPIPFNASNRVETVQSPQASPVTSSSYNPWVIPDNTTSWEDAVKENEDSFRDRSNSFPKLPLKPTRHT